MFVMFVFRVQRYGVLENPTIALMCHFIYHKYVIRTRCSVCNDMIYKLLYIEFALVNHAGT